MDGFSYSDVFLAFVAIAAGLLISRLQGSTLQLTTYAISYVWFALIVLIKTPMREDLVLYSFELGVSLSLYGFTMGCFILLAHSNKLEDRLKELEEKSGITPQPKEDVDQQ